MIMNLAAIEHKCNFNYCYALNDDTIIIKLRTGKEVKSAYIICEDPYVNGIAGKTPWDGKKEKMPLVVELEHHLLWEIRIVPQYKRLQYYFEINSDDEAAVIYENRIILKTSEEQDRCSKQYFKFPWMNSKDMIKPPIWVRNVVWYQIMPDRFHRGIDFENSGKFRNWDDTSNMTYADFYGGNIKGIEGKLDYIRELGFTGIYLTPVFQSASNHKYNTTDYELIDPDFGTENDFKRLIDCAHKKGIKIMIDAVFNHCGTGFFAWKDVVEKGEASSYYDWFFINSDQFITDDYKTKDGRYFSFAFEAAMPKLNTNNESVINYFIDLCTYWIRNWNIDGIRFDVGNEISHYFIKRLHISLKKIKPDIFLLGEIWHDAAPWLEGDEYDSVMNYPFYYCLNDFWADKSMNSKQFMYSMNYCLNLYSGQTNTVLFNFLDTHDTARVMDTCESPDILLQKLAVLMTMPGSPSIYYGTEIAMQGKCSPYNRQPMPWAEITNGRFAILINEFKRIINIRHNYIQLKNGYLEWNHREDHSRLLHYKRVAETEKTKINIIINAESNSIDLQANGNLIYSRNYFNNRLLANGIIIFEE